MTCVPTCVRALKWTHLFPCPCFSSPINSHNYSFFLSSLTCQSTFFCDSILLLIVPASLQPWWFFLWKFTSKLKSLLTAQLQAAHQFGKCLLQSVIIIISSWNDEQRCWECPGFECSLFCHGGVAQQNNSPMQGCDPSFVFKNSFALIQWSLTRCPHFGLVFSSLCHSYS